MAYGGETEAAKPGALGDWVRRYVYPVQAHLKTAPGALEPPLRRTRGFAGFGEIRSRTPKKRCRGNYGIFARIVGSFAQVPTRISACI